MINSKEGDKVVGGQVVSTWDPHTHPVITEVGGHIKFQDFVDGLTVTTQVDEVTGLSSTVVLDSKQRGGKDLRPTVKLLNAKGKEATFANTEIPAVYTLPPGALIALEDSARVSVGDELQRRTTTPEIAARIMEVSGNIDVVHRLAAGEGTRRWSFTLAAMSSCPSKARAG